MDARPGGNKHTHRSILQGLLIVRELIDGSELTVYKRDETYEVWLATGDAPNRMLADTGRIEDAIEFINKFEATC